MERKIEYKTIETKPRGFRQKALKILGRWQPTVRTLQRYEGDTNWTVVNDVN